MTSLGELTVSLDEFNRATSFLGSGDFDASRNEEWSSQMSKYQTAMNYFLGSVFNEKASEGKPGEPAPLLYPLKINIVKMMCMAQAGALWGQWEDHLLEFTCESLGRGEHQQSEAAKERADQAKAVVKETWDYSDINTKLHEASINQQVYGGTFFKLSVDFDAPHNVRVDKLMPYNVFVRYHPVQIDRILEAFIAIPIDKNEAKLAYGVTVQTDQTIYLEHWTEYDHETTVGDVKLPEPWSGPHPWGFVPLEYIPRVRSEGFYGLSLAEDVMGLQDELNTRMADMGDNINNSSHPIRWIRNYRGNEKKLTLGPDTLVNLGNAISGQDKPEMGVLDAQPEPPSSFEFIKFLVDTSRNVAGTSSVAFGEDEGSQRSGVTLVLRLWPLLQASKATRTFWTSGLSRLHKKILAIAKQKDVTVRYSDALANHSVQCGFAQLVPQDRQLLIDEIIKRKQEGLISPEEALTQLGVKVGTVTDEIERIKVWLKFEAEMAAKARPQPLGGVDGGQTQGGSNRPVRSGQPQAGNKGAGS